MIGPGARLARLVEPDGFAVTEAARRFAVWMVLDSLTVALAGSRMESDTVRAAGTTFARYAAAGRAAAFPNGQRLAAPSAAAINATHRSSHPERNPMTARIDTLDRDDVTLHYEVHGDDRLDKVLCMGGWGSFCHGRFGDAPRYVRENFQVLIWDYRGVGKSTDDRSKPMSMPLLASDAAALIDHLGWSRTHIVGLVGMGACVGQELAVARPELVRSLLMTGTWAFVDSTLRDQLELFRDVHQQMGFEAFQRFVAAFSFTGDFYAEHRDRLLGPAGAWGDLSGKADAHARLVEACLSHDTRDRLDQIRCPTFILHAALDCVTSPRTTMPLQDGIPGCQGETWADLAHVIAGKEMKVRFDQLLERFLSAAP